MTQKLWYLASPYSHDDPDVMDQRYKAALWATAKLLTAGVHVFSPIVHTHNLSDVAVFGHDFDVWKDYDCNMLDRCDGLIVLAIDGWTASHGVGQEIRRVDTLTSNPIIYWSGKDARDVLRVAERFGDEKEA